MKRLFRKRKQHSGESICRNCGAAITKTSGFWPLWRDDKSTDPEYCPGGNHAHRPI